MIPAIVGLVILALALGKELTPGMLLYTAIFAGFLAAITRKKKGS